jgi:type I restriction enzyme S subunit
MWKGMTGTSGTMPKISKGIVENIPVIVPPIDIQNRVVSYIQALFAICDQLKSHLKDAQTTQLRLADTLTDNALARA